jgi:hypothetical protein
MVFPASTAVRAATINDIERDAALDKEDET